MARKHNEIARLLEKNALTAQQISGLVGAGAGGLGGYLSADDKASFGDRAFRTLGGAALGGGAGYGLGHFIPQRQAAQAAQAVGHAAPAAPAAQVAQKAEQAAVQRANQIHVPAGANLSAGGVSAAAPTMGLSGTVSAPRSAAPAARASAPATGTAATALAPAAAAAPEIKNPVFGSVEDYIAHSGTMPFAQDRARAAFSNPQVPRDYNSLQSAFALQGASPEELQAVLTSRGAADWEKTFARDLLSQKAVTPASAAPGLSSIGRPGMAQASGRTALRPAKGFMAPGAGRVFSESPIRGGTRVNVQRNDALIEAAHRARATQQDEPALRSALEELAARRQARQQIPIESAAAMPGESLGLSSIGRPGMAEAAGRTALRPTRGFMEPGAGRVFSEAPVQGGTRINVQRNNAPAARAAVAEGGPAAAALAPARPPVRPPPLPGSTERPIPLTDADMVMPPARPPVRPPPLPGSTERPIPLTDADMVFSQPGARPTRRSLMAQEQARTDALGLSPDLGTRETRLSLNSPMRPSELERATATIPLTEADMVRAQPPALPGSAARPIPLTEADMVLAQPLARPSRRSLMAQEQARADALGISPDFGDRNTRLRLNSPMRPSELERATATIPMTEADIVGHAAGPAVFTPKESPRMVQEPSVMLGDDMRDAIASQFALETPLGLSSIGRPGMAQASGRTALRPAQGFMEPGAGRVFSEAPIQGGTRVNVRRNDAQLEAAERARQQLALREALKTPFEGPRFSSGEGRVSGLELEAAQLENAIQQRETDERVQRRQELFLQGLAEMENRMRARRGLPPLATKFGSLRDSSRLKAAAQHSALLQFGLGALSPVTSFQFRD